MTGTARNPLGQTVPSNEVCAAMLDGAGKTIGVGEDHLAPLDPGASESFDVKISAWKGKPDRGLLGAYTLQAYSAFGH